jgi:methylphosphotriester-DNA--protein-cysteine methyltransferase
MERPVTRLVGDVQPWGTAEAPNYRQITAEFSTMYARIAEALIMLGFNNERSLKQAVWGIYRVLPAELRPSYHAESFS